GGGLPGGLVAATQYFVANRATNTFMLAPKTAWQNVQFTANAGTDRISAPAHGLVDGNVILLFNSGGALPTGLTAATAYYVKNSTTNDFQVSLTSGGTIVDILLAGSGTNTYQRIVDITSVGTGTQTFTKLRGYQISHDALPLGMMNVEF